MADSTARRWRASRPAAGALLLVLLAGCSDPEPAPEGDAAARTTAAEAVRETADVATATAEPVRTVADFPDATTTGVPEGVELEPSESLTIEEDGAVVEGLEITGSVTVAADDVVIRNTRILNRGAYPIRNDGGERLLVEDVEIDGQGKGSAAVAFDDYTLRRVNIHHVAEGPRIAGGDVVIEDSYIHHLVQVGDNHTDVIQMVSGSNVVIRGNHLQSHNPDEDILGNAAFQFGEDDGPVTDCLVEGNYLEGGNYTINGGGAGTTGAACIFRDNSFGRTSRYGPAGNLGPNVVFDETNVWIETHTPVWGEED